MGTYDELTQLDDQSPAARVAPKPEKSREEIVPKTTRKPAQEVTRRITPALELSRGKPREKSREISRDLPSRDEIQEFSFRLRDELKVKVQAEVPHGWQKELEETARKLDVKKLELYRFILGEFLGKVKRKRVR